MTRKCGRLIKLSIAVASRCFQTISHHRFLDEMRDVEMSRDGEFLHDFSKTAEIHSDSKKRYMGVSINSTHIHTLGLAYNLFVYYEYPVTPSKFVCAKVIDNNQAVSFASFFSLYSL